MKSTKKIDNKTLSGYMKLCVDGLDDVLREKINDDRFCFGWLNEVVMAGGKKKYVIFLDYDGLDLEIVKKDCIKLQNKYRLGSAIILRSMHGYHAYFLDVVTRKIMLEIMKASKCDRKYYNTGKKFGSRFVLRLGMKKESRMQFALVVPSKERGKGKFSYYHLYYLMRKFPELLLDSTYKNDFYMAQNAVVGRIKCAVYSTERDDKNEGKL